MVCKPVDWVLGIEANSAVGPFSTAVIERGASRADDFDVSAYEAFGNERVVLREPTATLRFCLLAFFGVLGGIIHVESRWLYFGGTALLPLLIYWPRVIVEAGGVTVVNVVKRRLAWTDITALEVRGGYWRQGLVFKVRNGRHVWPYGLLLTGTHDRIGVYDSYRVIHHRWRQAVDRVD